MIKLKDSSEITVFKIIKRQTDSTERMHLSSKGLPRVRSEVPYELSRPQVDGFYALQAQLTSTWESDCAVIIHFFYSYILPVARTRQLPQWFQYPVLYTRF